MMNDKDSLFKTNYVPAAAGADELFTQEFVANKGPVTCLGMEFDNDDARRAHFTELLRQKLKDPEFRKIEGFPIGEDEDILALSDPPYYTACPNPWLADFVAEWENQKPEKPQDYHYHREPFAADVSEGKNDPIYNAHSYHTKVPHKAIMRYILHYTEPGDIVFDGFCGSGMTGVAAQMCGNRKTVESLGYKVDDNGVIYQEEDNGNIVEFSKLGARKVILNDLSPAATFITYNYNHSNEWHGFERKSKKTLQKLNKFLEQFWQTLHTDGITKGSINYVVWSDINVCPNCSKTFTYYDEVFTKSDDAIEYHSIFSCPYCLIKLSKNPSTKLLTQKPEKKYDSHIDDLTHKVESTQMQTPVLINYSINKIRYEKKPDEYDLALLDQINCKGSENFIPIRKIPKGYNTEQPIKSHGLTYMHQFYTKRILFSIAQMVKLSGNDAQLSFLLGSALPKLTKMNRYMPQHGGRALVGPIANTLYIPPICVENNVIDQLVFQSKKISKALNNFMGSSISTQAAQNVNIPKNSLDYIFLDPPFGSNIMYSELSYIRESWLKVFTNNIPEAIENKIQKKGVNEYKELITECFKKAYDCLKPGRWLTVEFSNTKAAIWNSIQNSLADSGFIIASVSVLDKTRGGFHSMIGSTAVKQDLVISAYKPNGGFEERFVEEATKEEGVWDFVKTHLSYLPVIKKQKELMMTVPERDPRLLYDQVIAYYVRKGYPVPLDSKDFQQGLSEKFVERDGMYFLPDQAAEYDKKKALGGTKLGQMILFISDESSAIAWLRQLLKEKPQSFQDINPQFMQELSGWSKNEVGLELSTLLEQNFIMYDGVGPVPAQIHTYLSTNWKDMRELAKDDPALVQKAKDRWYVPDPNKAGDLEKLREKALLKEFAVYKEAKKKIKVFRLEAVRAGFKRAWQEKDYALIISVGDKLPKNVMEEDPKLLMWYDLAQTRMEG